MFAFKPKYFIVAIIIFVIEVIIAIYVNDDFIRPYAGDVLVVIMIYCFIRAFLNWNICTSATVTFLFACFIETLQYFNIVELLGLKQYLVARIVIGTHFSWFDIIAYSVGIILVLLLEKIINRNNFKQQ